MAMMSPNNPNYLLQASQLANPGNKKVGTLSTNGTHIAGPGDTTPAVTQNPANNLPGTYTVPPLPTIPSLPPVYTGTSLTDAQAALTAAQNAYNAANQAFEAGSSTTSYNPNSQISQENKLALTNAQEALQQAQTNFTNAQQGNTANQTEQAQVSLLPADIQNESQNLNNQAQYTLSQLDPQIQEKLQSLGILNGGGGALTAVEGQQAQNLADTVSSSLGNYMNSGLQQAGAGTSNALFNSTLQNLSTQGQQNIANAQQQMQDSYAQAMQQQLLNAQQQMQVPFWQQLILGIAGGGSKGIGSGIGQFIGNLNSPIA